MRNLISLFIFLSLSIPAYSQEPLTLEDEREKQLREMGVKLPNPESIRVTAESEFAKPISEQSADKLEEIAKTANTYANLVSKISEEYNDYIRENSRYDFVTEVVRAAPIVDSLLNADVTFKMIRDRAYVNLGRLALAEGKDMKAFLLFNDAYRLSSFSCSNGKEACIRYEAEQEMKKLLGIEGDSYVHWKK